MKFALLGADDETIALARYLAGHADHQLVAAYEPGAFEDRLRTLAPQAATPWEALLHEPVADAVIVATRPEAERAEQLGKLAKAAVPLLVVWPACDVVTAYELEMIRRDTQAPLWAWIPGRLHPAVAKLSEMAAQGADSPLGRMEQIVVERALKERDRETVLRRFTRDMALVRAIAGDMNKISALGPGPASSAWGNLSVQMAGASEALVRWSVQPVTDWSGGRLTIFGAEGKATLDMPSDARPWSLTVSGSRSEEETFDSWSEPATVIESFAHICRGEAVAPAWQEACRDVETAATVERSLTRGKTIELYEDEVSEEATFKGMMAVGGCGVLMLGLLALLIAAAVEGLQLPFRDHLWWRLWPVYLLAPILFFLLLQPLRLVFRKPPDHSSTGER